MPERIVVIGMWEDPPFLSERALCALEEAELVVGGARHLENLLPLSAPTFVITKEIGEALDAIGATQGTVCVLASGDPGFFGILRPLAQRFGTQALEVHPALSSVAAAFARARMPWDDAVVVSAHGRPLDDAAAVVAGAPKAAVLVSDSNPPQALGMKLLSVLGQERARQREVWVCSRLGTPEESVTHTDLDTLASGDWEPLSVVLVSTTDRSDHGPSLAWGLREREFDHRDGMITKSEVRAVVLGKLELHASGVLWDIGAGSGSVAIEASRLAPALEVHAVEHDADAAGRIRRNAESHGVGLNVVEGRAPEVLRSLPDPDRVFVGGGGMPVVEEGLKRLRTSGRIVATFAALDRAARAAELLGDVIEIAVSRGERFPDGAVRLVAQNPVFVAWGPRQ